MQEKGSSLVCKSVSRKEVTILDAAFAKASDSMASGENLGVWRAWPSLKGPNYRRPGTRACCSLEIRALNVTFFILLVKLLRYLPCWYHRPILISCQSCT
jgi:hypothetical protein